MNVTASLADNLGIRVAYTDAKGQHWYWTTDFDRVAGNDRKRSLITISRHLDLIGKSHTRLELLQSASGGPQTHRLVDAYGLTVLALLSYKPAIQKVVWPWVITRALAADFAARTAPAVVSPTEGAQNPEMALGIVPNPIGGHFIGGSAPAPALLPPTTPTPGPLRRLAAQIGQALIAYSTRVAV